MSLAEVFVSHAHADNQLCDQYVTKLRDYDVDVWYDRTNLQSGQLLSDEIGRQIERRNAMIVFLTENSTNSLYVKLEVGAFQSLMSSDSHRVLLPIRLEPCRIPILMRGIKWFEAVGRSVDDVVDEVVRTLKASISDNAGRTSQATVVTHTASGQPIVIAPAEGNRVSWSPDGQYIAFQDSSYSIAIWDIPTNSRILTLPEDTISQAPELKDYLLDEVIHLEWSQNGRFLCLGGTNYTGRGYIDYSGDVCEPGDERAIWVWAMPDGAPILYHSLGTMRYERPHWSPRSAKLALVTSSQAVEVWDLNTCQVFNRGSRSQKSTDYRLRRLYDNIPTYRGHTARIPTLDLIASPKDAESFDRDDVAEYESLEDDEFEEVLVAWSSDGTMIASMCYPHSRPNSGLVHVWDARQQTLICEWPCSVDDMVMRDVYEMEWSPTRSALGLAQSTKHGGTLVIWDVLSGHIVSCVQDAVSVGRVHWSHDGLRVAGVADLTPLDPNSNWSSVNIHDGIVVWNPMTGSLCGKFEHPTDRVDTYAWSPVRRQLAVSCSGLVHIWDPEVNTVIQTYGGHASNPTEAETSSWLNRWSEVPRVYALTWSPDGKYVASIGNGSMQVWPILDS